MKKFPRPAAALYHLALLILATTLACSSCGGTRRLSEPPPVPVYDTGVAIFTPMGFGRGCPVRDDIYTAQHVLRTPMRSFTGAWWSDRHGNNGPAKFMTYNTMVDVAMLHAVGSSSPANVTIGKPGTEIYFFDYDYSSPETAFDSILRRGSLLKRAGGHLIFQPSPSRGTSGGCLYNKKGQAIGIIVWSIEMEDESRVGLAVQFPKEWAE